MKTGSKRYSKAIDMIENSILMLFNTEVLLSIFCWESLIYSVPPTVIPSILIVGWPTPTGRF